MSDTTDITISELPVVVRDGEPRARDLDIAERLGLSQLRDIRQLIERNRGELETFGALARYGAAPITSGKGRAMEVQEFWLNEEQALLVATLSRAPNSSAVRAMLIRTFVAWRRGHLPSELPADVAEMVRRTDGICRMTIGKITAMEKSLPVLAAQIASEILPAMLKTAMASQAFVMRRGKTAGQIWHDHGFPPIKVTCWFGNRLAQMGCAIEGGGCGEVGLTKARLFDPDKADAWLKNGGRLMVETKIAERRGQGALRLVAP